MHQTTCQIAKETRPAFIVASVQHYSSVFSIKMSEETTRAETHYGKLCTLVRLADRVTR